MPRKASTKVNDFVPTSKLYYNGKQQISQQAHINRQNANRGRMRMKAAGAKDIGNLIHPPVNVKRKESCRGNLKLFLLTYFPDIFYSKFSEDHDKVVQRVEETVIRGGNYCLAMPRGYGKSVICSCAIIFGVLYGYRKFIVLVAGTSSEADRICDNIKYLVETNDLLEQDFSEMIAPIRALDGVAARGSAQTCNGQPTRIEWTANDMMFPLILDANNNRVVGSSAVVMTRGITSQIRGLNKVTIDGAIRPDLCLVDDPQSAESAESVSQCKKREKKIKNDIMGLGGYNRKISVLITCTIIQKDDLADKMLDRELNPSWHGEKYKRMESFPKDTKLWEQYIKLRRADLKADDDKLTKSTKYYIDNREEMDKGAVVKWDRWFDGEVSSIQSCYNYICDNGMASFLSECQNEPLAEIDIKLEVKAEQVLSRINNYKICEVPKDTICTVAFADINYSGLHWTLASFDKEGRCYVINYGKYPERGVLVVKNENDVIRDTKVANGLSKLEGILKGFNVPIHRFGIDGGYCNHVVKKWLEAKRNPAYVMTKGVASKERAANVSSRALQTYTQMELMALKDGSRYYYYNSCYYREKMLKAFLSDPAAPGSCSLFKASEDYHSPYSIQVTSEQLMGKKQKFGKLEYKWTKPKPGTTNDWGDSLTCCHVLAASCGIGGATNITVEPPKQKKRKVVVPKNNTPPLDDSYKFN